MKHVVLLLSALFSALLMSGQSHSFKMGCRYFNQKTAGGTAVRGEAVCPACYKQREDESKARQAEDKRRLDAEAANLKIKQDKELKDAISRQEADIKARQTETLKITIEDKKPVKTPEESKKNNEFKGVKGMLYNAKNIYPGWGTACGRCGGFGDWTQTVLLRYNGDTVRFPFKNFHVYALFQFDSSNSRKFPANTALLALYDNGHFSHGRGAGRDCTATFDIVDGSGKRYFNEENTYVAHLYENFFLKVKKFSDFYYFLPSYDELNRAEDITIVNINSGKQFRIEGKHDIKFSSSQTNMYLKRHVGEGGWLFYIEIERGYKQGWDFYYVTKNGEFKSFYLSYGER